MDSFLEALLDAERLTATGLTDRVEAMRVLSREFSHLSLITAEEWPPKLSAMADDVRKLDQQAERAAAHAARAADRRDRAHQMLETLEAFAARFADQPDPRDQPDDHVHEQHVQRDDVVSAPSNREAVLRVMRRQPDRQGTPQLVHDELRRAGRPVTRANVQAILQREAEKQAGVVRRVKAGVYALVDRTPPSAPEIQEPTSDLDVEATAYQGQNGNGNGRAPWLTPEILQRVAEEAAERFLAAHPGESDPELLVDVAQRRVAGWIERHHEEPYDEGHLRRLMKTAVSDLYRRGRRHARTNGGTTGVAA